MASIDFDPERLEQVERQLQAHLEGRQRLKWSPRPYQEDVLKFMRGSGKRAILVWARQHGKDETCHRYVAEAAATRPANYWILYPTGEQARNGFWNVVDPAIGIRRIDLIFPPKTRAKILENEMRIVLKNGSVVSFLGSDNYDRLVGGTLAGLVFSEWALSDPSSWAYLQPSLQRADGWAMFNFTPRGRNHAHVMFEHAQTSPEWFASLVTADKAGVLSEEQLNTVRLNYVVTFGEERGQAHFEQEYGCSFAAATPGCYYAKEMRQLEEKGYITDVPHDRSKQCEGWWDLGYGDATAIWVVQRQYGGAFHAIDYIENSGVGLEWYARELGERDYTWSHQVLPHDVEVGDLTTGQTRKRFLEQLGFTHGGRFGPIEVCPRPGREEDKIEATRALLPRCRFDAVNCKRGIEALKSYHAKWDDRARVFRKHPEHDWSSHPADAFAYGAMMSEKPPPGTGIRRGKIAYPPSGIY
jgi:phage terminase large subunit